LGLMVGRSEKGLSFLLATACYYWKMSYAGYLYNKESSKPPNTQEKKCMNEASGEFEVKLIPVDIGDEKLGMMTIDKQYHDDLTATGKGRMLTGMTEVKDSGVYVAVERVSGKLKGAEGVRGRPKPASGGEMKSSHFAGSEIRRWFSATPLGLLEKADVECPQDGEDSLDTTVTRRRLVTAADRS
jgi:Protein of unknown function (DUF3224)